MYTQFKKNMQCTCLKGSGPGVVKHMLHTFTFTYIVQCEQHACTACTCSIINKVQCTCMHTLEGSGPGVVVHKVLDSLFSEPHLPALWQRELVHH